MVQLVGMSLMGSSLGRGFGGGTRCVDCQSLKCGVTTEYHYSGYLTHKQLDSARGADGLGRCPPDLLYSFNNGLHFTDLHAVRSWLDP